MCRDYAASLSKKHYALISYKNLYSRATNCEAYCQMYDKEQAAEQDSQESRSKDDCIAEFRARPRTETNR